MGSSGAKTVKAEEVVTPATAREADSTIQNGAENQEEKRRRLRGIRSTYTRYATAGEGGSGTTGSSDKLG